MRCRDCEYIDALLETCNASDQAIINFRQHAHKLHRQIAIYERIRESRERKIAPNIGIYCVRCEKPHPICLCRSHEWIVKEEKMDAPGVVGSH